MYINFWYPICTSAELEATEPVESQVMGFSFVAFRDAANTAHVLANTCAHRGGSLANGSIKDGCIVCPYHGWRYGGDGKCKLVTSLEADAKPHAPAKVDSYPLRSSAICPRKNVHHSTKSRNMPIRNGGAPSS